MRKRKPYYEALGIPRDATPAEVKRAYRALAKRLHPDRLRNPELARGAEERLKEINAAWNEYRATQKRAGENGGRPHSGHHAGSAADSAGRSTPPSRESEEDRFSQRPGEKHTRGAHTRSGRPSRDRYRAERARAVRERAERERRERECAEQVRRDRDCANYERRLREHEQRVGLFRFLLAGVAGLVAICLVVLVALLLVRSFR